MIASGSGVLHDRTDSGIDAVIVGQLVFVHSTMDGGRYKLKYPDARKRRRRSVLERSDRHDEL